VNALDWLRKTIRSKLPRNRIDRGSPSYGETWDQLARADAIYSICATTQQKQFERWGREEADRIRQWITPESLVLDVGCGIGRVEKHLAPHCRELHSVDVSEEMLHQARKRLASSTNVFFHHTSATDLSFTRSGTFDLVFSLLVLQHIEKEDAFLSLCEICRVLKPGGLAYLQFPSLFADVYFESFVQTARMTERPMHRMRLYTPQEVYFLLDKIGFNFEDRLTSEVEILVLARKPQA
jgi:ubiquinone/menaquinone biosynthesis C-methylase UbiE